MITICWHWRIKVLLKITQFCGIPIIIHDNRSRKQQEVFESNDNNSCNNKKADISALMKKNSLQ